MSEVVTVTRLSDLYLLDMVREGVFVREIHFGGGPSSWYVAPAWVVEHEGPCLAIEWGEPVDIEPEFPMTVIRGIEPPRKGDVP